MYVVNSFNVCGKSVSVLLTSTVYTVNPRFAFIRGGRFILSINKKITKNQSYCTEYSICAFGSKAVILAAISVN